MHGKVVLYTTPMCGPCEQVKNYLQALGVEFTVIDVMMDEEAADLLERKGIRSAPALGGSQADVQLKRDQLVGLAANQKIVDPLFVGGQAFQSGCQFTATRMMLLHDLLFRHVDAE